MTMRTETDSQFVDRLTEEVSRKIFRFLFGVLIGVACIWTVIIGISTESRRVQAELDAPFMVSAADLARLQTIKGCVVHRQDNFLSYVCSQSGWNTSGSKR